MEARVRLGNEEFQVRSDDNYLEGIGSEFEPNMVRLFQALVGPQDVVADVGANIGLTAILFSRIAGQVVAFEPSPTTFSFLEENVGRAGCSNVQLHNIGLGREKAQTTITFAHNNRSGGFISNVAQPKEGHITETVHIETLDEFCERTGFAPDFLKIDVEGFEMDVLDGGRCLLARKKPLVVLEMNHFCLAVLHRIALPDFVDHMRSIFPVLYAVDADNRSYLDMHIDDVAYHVMHEHVVNRRFPNLVGGFDDSLQADLEALRLACSDDEESLPESDGVVIDHADGEVLILDAPDGMFPGERAAIAVRVFNNGSQFWPAHGKNPVLLSYHWLNADGEVVVHDGERSAPDHDGIQPRERYIALLSVVAPSVPGVYDLQVTLVQEGICWMEDIGLRADRCRVAVGSVRDA